MQFSNTHVLIVDYDEGRRDTLCSLFDDHAAQIHPAKGKAEALGILWQLASNGIVPRAIMANWLMDDPQAREFFSLVGREIDHTCLDLLKNAIKIDESISDAETIMICYTDEKMMGEALLELQAEHLNHRVALACLNDGLQELADSLFRDERTRIMKRLAQDIETKSDFDFFASAVVEPVHASYDEDSETTSYGTGPVCRNVGQSSSGIRRALRRLSR